MLFMSSNGLLRSETPPLLDVISLCCLTAAAPAKWLGLWTALDAFSQISNNACTHCIITEEAFPDGDQGACNLKLCLG